MKRRRMRVTSYHAYMHVKEDDDKGEVWKLLKYFFKFS